MENNLKTILNLAYQTESAAVTSPKKGKENLVKAPKKSVRKRIKMKKMERENRTITGWCRIKTGSNLKERQP